jgi:hypothetical protein
MSGQKSKVKSQRSKVNSKQHFNLFLLNCCWVLTFDPLVLFEVLDVRRWLQAQSRDFAGSLRDSTTTKQMRVS